jgi:UDP-4-amino-4,6-dideoxy-N-acetyl-beta-L-altrosamine transaminase
MNASDPFIPYGRQSLDEADIRAVVEVLQSDWLTQGPAGEKFEQAFAKFCGARFAIAVSSGTAALHLACLAAGFKPGDEVVTSPITFAATANAILYAGARPVFAEIDPETANLDPEAVKKRLTPRTRGLLPVHFAGQPADLQSLSRIAEEHDLTLIEDAAHALGATYEVAGRSFRVGACAHSRMAIFSCHPVKHIATGEGGVITTNDEELATRLKELRSHGITRDPERMENCDGPWYYEMRELGFNYRLTDIQAALGASQLQKADRFIARRRAIAARYDRAFAAEPALAPLVQRAGTNSSWHLYVLRVRGIDRKAFFNRLRAAGLGVNVHYIPVHLQPFYRKNLGCGPGDFPAAENYYENAVTIPLFPGLDDSDIERVIETVLETARRLRRETGHREDP